MSNLQTRDKIVLEKLFQMDGGYVLDFSNRTFREFFLDDLKIDIYDEKYMYASGSKANILRGFWNVEDNNTVARSITKLVEYIETQLLIGALNPNDFSEKIIDKAKQIAEGLLNDRSSTDKEVEKFLQKDFVNTEEKLNTIDTASKDVIKQRLVEIGKCIEYEIPLASIFLIGSTLEGILADLSMSNADEFCSSGSAPKKNGKPLSIKKWKLDSLINAAYELGILKLNTKKFSHDLKDFRNFIHPKEQSKSDFNPDMYSAKICFQVLKSAIFDINQWKEQQ